MSGLLLCRGLLCHRLNVRLLCDLILCLAHTLDLVEAQVINDGCRAVLFRELSRLVPESASYLLPVRWLTPERTGNTFAILP